MARTSPAVIYEGRVSGQSVHRLAWVLMVLILSAALPVAVDAQEPPERVFSLIFWSEIENKLSPPIPIPDYTGGMGTQSVRDVITVPVGGAIRLLSVSALITHFITENLRVTLISPSGQEVVLHDRVIIPEHYLTYTITWNDGNLPALAELLGTNPLGDWTLTIGDYRRVDIGTLNGWSLSMTRSMLPATVQMSRGVGVARLSLLGAAPLGADETLTVDFAYAPEGGGVSVSSPDPVRFTAGSTVAELTLSAATNAVEGILTATVSETLPSTLQIVPADLSVEVLSNEYALEWLSSDLIEESRFPDVLIPNNTSMQSLRDVIAVPAGGTVMSLSVSVSITTSNRSDLRVTLISPSGKEVVLHNRTGGRSNLRETWNDGNLPVLASLLGTNSQGDWTLTAGHYNLFLESRLDEWSLSMRRSVPPGSAARMLAGATTRVSLSLLGEAPLGADEVMTVDFAYAPQGGGGVSVSSPDPVRFTAESTVVDLTLSAAQRARPGTLTATVSGTLPSTLLGELRIAPANLSVEIPPREYMLSFTTSDGAPLVEVQRVLANDTLPVWLNLSGEIALGADEPLMVDFDYNPRRGGVSVSSPAQVRFTADSTLVKLTLSAATNALDGTLIATVSDMLPNTLPIAPADLSVEILPREYALAFMTLDGAPLVGVPAGATTRVRLSLLGEVPLGRGETLTVNFDYAPEDGGVSVSSPAQVFFTENSTLAEFTLSAAADASSGILTATVFGTLPNTLLDASTDLSVDVQESLERVFSLAFSSWTEESRSPGTSIPDGTSTQSVRDVIAVSAGGAIVSLSVSVSITTSNRGDLQVTLISPSGQEVVLHNQTDDPTSNLRKTWNDGDLPALADLLGKNPQGDWTLTVGDYRLDDAGTLDEWSLSMAVYLPPGTAQTVQVGTTTRVALSLLGASPLGEDEMLTVSFSYDPQDDGGVMSSPMEVVFIESSRTVDLTLSAAVDAREGTLTATVSGTLLNTLPIVPADLQVEIVPREFTLMFTTLDNAPLEMVQVQAGATTRVRLSLSGDISLGADETLTVSFVYAAENGGTDADVTVQESMGFTATSGNANVIDLTLNAPAAARPGALTASIEDAVNAIITPTSLQVEILPREYALTFTTLDGVSLSGEVQRVQANDTVPVRLSLSGEVALGRGEVLMVGFNYGGSLSVAVLSPPTVVFAADSTAIDLTLRVPLTLGAGTLTATVSVVENAVVRQGLLAVLIVPREYALTFTALDGEALDTLRVPAGAMTRVSLGLSGEAPLGMDETLTVGFDYNPEGGGVSVPSPDPVRFTAESTEVDLTVDTTAAAATGTLTAKVETPSITIASSPTTTLQVEIVPREYALTFTAPDGGILETARVPAGATTRVRLSLSGEASLGADETLTVSFDYEPEVDGVDGGVAVSSPPTVVFTASRLTIDLTLSASMAAQPGVLMASVSGMLMNTLPIAPTDLSVEILPREYALTFTTLDGEALDVARMPAGTTTRVRLSLSGEAPLGADEMLTVSFDYKPEADGVDGGVTVLSPTTVVFAESRLMVDLTLNAPIAARSGMLTASIEDAVNAMISPTSLQTEILLREFTLTFTTLDGEALDVARMPAGTTTQVRLSLSGEASLGADEMLTVSFDYEPEADGVDGGVTVLSPTTVVFAESRLMVDLTLNATAAARSGMLTASIEDAVNATILPTSLQTEILLRKFTLAFMPPEVGIVPGSTRAVTLTLKNAARLEAGEQVPVVLTLSEGSSLTLSSTEFTFGRDTATHVVDLGVPAGTPAGSGTLRATVSASHDLANVDFASAAVRVDVIDDRIFTWVFRSVEAREALSMAVVVAGGSRGIVLSLESDQGALLIEGESVGVSLSFVGGDGITVTPPALTFTSTAPMGSLTLQAEGTAPPGQLMVMVTGTTPDPLPNATVATTAALPVVVVREFTLAFTTLDDAPLITAQVQAGATTRVSLSLSGAAPLGMGETLTVTFSYDPADGGVSVFSPPQVSFVEDSTAIDLTLNAPIAARSGMLTASIEDAENATILPTSLQVEIVPREYALAFTTLDDAPLETARVQAGATKRVRLSLSGEASLGADETLTVSFVYVAENGGTGADVTVQESVSFTTASGTMIDLTLNAPVAARSGMLMASIEDAVNALIPPTSLPVEILPRGFTLTFTTSDDAPLETARVQAGDMTRVRLSLSGDASLGADETLAVNFVYAAENGSTGADVTVQESVDFTATSSTAIDLTLNAPIAARSGMLTASIEDAVNAFIPPTSLPVEILPREFTLMFTTSDDAPLETARMLAGTTTRVRLSLSGEASLGTDETLAVNFVYAAENGSTGPDVTVQESVDFTTASGTVIDLTLNAPIAAQSGMLTASIEDAVNAFIPPTSLPVGILPREFTLMFTTSDDAPLETARMLAGTTTRVRLSLSGAASLGTDEMLVVSFVYAAENGSTGPDVTVQESVDFTAAGSTAIDLTLNAPVAARPGMLTASIEDAVNAMILPTSLQVEIVPREYALTFTTLDGEALDVARMLAGTTTRVRLSLSGEAPLGADETLTVSFDYEPQADGVTVSSPTTVVFTESSLTIDLTLNAPIAAQSGILTASVSSALPNTLPIAPTDLSVAIVPREFALAFTTLDGEALDVARMPAGTTTRVRLSLSGEAPLGADETLTVSFVYEPQADGMADDVTVSSPLTVVFIESSLTVDLTLNATAVARPGTLTANIEDAVNAIIPPTSLQVEILPREFALAFMPTKVGILPGSTRAVTLTLENARRLETGEQVPVVLSLDEGSSLTLSSTEVTFGRDIDTHVVDLGVPAGAPVGSGTLRATVSASHGLMNVDFTPAAVRVEVIDSRIFAWAFRAVETREALSAAVVVAGGSRGIVLSLESDQGALLDEDESVGVSLSLVDGDGITVTPPALTFTSIAPMGSLTLQADSTATPALLLVVLTGTTPVSLPRATVAPTAALPVMVVREFTLAFTTLDDAPLITAQVQAGATAQVSLSLSGAAPLGMDETLTVTFSYDPVDGGVSVSSPTQASFVEGNTTIDLTLNVAADARPGALTANVSGASLDTLPIAPADLPVEILPREFALMFTTLDDAPLETARVQAGATTRVRLSLSGAAPLGADEMLLVSFVYEPQADGVTVSSPPRVVFTAGSLTVDLTLNAAAAARPSTLTASIEDAVNAMITPTSLQVEIVPREFTLTFTTLDDAPLEAARVLAAATTRVRLTLSGDGSLGEDETLTVSFVYEPSGGGTDADVAVQESADFTATSGDVIDLTLNALAAARPGALTARIEDAVNAIITPASLPVEILPREFALAFTTLDDAPLETAQVQAVAVMRVRLSLSGETSLGEDEMLTVSFVYEPQADGVTVSSPSMVVFVANSTVIDLTLNAPAAAQSGALTARIEDAVNAIITPASLPVEILTREFALTFTAFDGAAPETVQVPAGAATRVRLTLSGATSETLLGEDEMLTVSFVYTAEGDGMDADVTVRESVNFTATSGPLIDLTLRASRAAQPGMGTLTASIEDAVNASITPASLSVEIVPSIPGADVRLQVRVLLEGALQ